MIYLDNSATTFYKPKAVIKAVQNALTVFPANPGRSGHQESLKAAMVIEKTREKLSEFVGAERPEKVIFTQSCTDALNLAILGSVVEGGHVICTINDHNSCLRPLFELQNAGKITVSVASPSKPHILSAEDISPLIRENTYMVCVNHLSNVDGMPADIDAIGELCAEKNITFLVDGAQSIGHIKIDMLKQHIDFLALAPHKGLYAPQGIGSLVMSSHVKPIPLRYGGTGTDTFSLLQPTNLPEYYESGTLSTPAISGLGAGLDFVNENFTNIAEKLEDLTTCLHYELSRLDTEIYTHPDNAFGVLSFNINRIDSRTVGTFLDEKYGICVRAGAHCAPLKHKNIGTEELGTIRVSLSYFNTYSEIEKFVRAIKDFIRRK